MAAKDNWWQHPLRIVDFIMPSAEQIGAFDPKEVVGIKTRMHFNAEHLGMEDVDNGSTALFYFQSGAARKVVRDILGDYLTEAHEKGLKVLIYFNVHWAHDELAAEHPDWMARDAEGKIIVPGYGSGARFCVNSPWREWSYQVIRDLAVYPIDGVFLDGPGFVQNGCYCEGCAQKFRQQYGKELPRVVDWSNPDWRDFVEFRYQSIVEYVKGAQEVLKQQRPEAIFYINGHGLSPGWAGAIDNRRLIPYQDLLGAEGGFIYGDLRQTPLWKPGATAKLLETQAGGKPRVIFIAGRQGPWSRYILTRPEAKLLIADTVANGANPWYGLYLSSAKEPPVSAAAEMNAFLEKNAAYYEGTESAANVALVWSTRTVDFYSADIPETDFTRAEPSRKAGVVGNFLDAFSGYYEALFRAHVPFDVIDEKVLEGDLKRYELVILPNCACLSEAEAKHVADFVQNGGNLVATFDTSLYTEFGQRRDDFLLADVFGVHSAGGYIGPFPYDHLKREQHALTEGIEQTLFPAPEYGVKVVPTTAQSVLMFRQPTPSRYGPLPPESEYPAILINRYGSGNVIYFSGNFDEAHFAYLLPEHRRLLTNPVHRLARPLIEVDGLWESTEVVLRYQRKADRLLIHFVNFTGQMGRPIERVIPCRDVQVRLPGLNKAKAVKALWSDKALDYRVDSNGITFTVPLIEEYEVVAVEGMGGSFAVK